MGFKKEREDRLSLYLTTVWNEIQWSSENSVLNTTINKVVGWVQPETDNISEYAVEVGYIGIELGGKVFLTGKGVTRAKKLSCEEKYIEIKAKDLIHKEKQAAAKAKRLIRKEQQIKLEKAKALLPKEKYTGIKPKPHPVQKLLISRSPIPKPNVLKAVLPKLPDPKPPISKEEYVEIVKLSAIEEEVTNIEEFIDTGWVSTIVSWVKDLFSK
jgi:hypothetical protein